MIKWIPKLFAYLLLPVILVSCASGPSTKSDQKASLEKLNVYADVVHSIFEQNCITCHNAKDLEGELNMETYAGLLKGGDTGYSIAKGDRDDSELYLRITLPHEDDDFMPAEGKPPLSDLETALVGWWIDEDADPYKTASDYTEIPPHFAGYFQEMLDSMLSPEELEKRENARQELYAQMTSIRQATGALIIPIEPDATEFSVETFSVQKTFKDESLEQMKPYADKFVEADFSNTQLTDESILTLAKFKNLQSLNLSNTRILGANLGKLASLENLESLNLYGTGLTLNQVSEVSKLTQLKNLYLFQTELQNEATIAQLKEALPNCNFSLN